jgi:purine-nucleoside phosphorylase
MTVHIGAKQNEIANTVLMPGDPMRAKFIAETMLEDVICYSKVRGMLGFTGTYNGKRVSVQGSGMGIPSISIYVNELISTYGVKNIIRVGSCGAFKKEIKINDVILAIGASTNSAVNKLIFGGRDYAPTANFSLLQKAYEVAKQKNIPVNVGNVLSGDSFYDDDSSILDLWIKYNVIAVDMETSALYTLAAKFGVKALTILTVSDNLITGEETTSEAREKTIADMVGIALEIAE